MGSVARAIANERRTSLQYYRSLDHAVKVFCTYFGPTMRVLRTVDGEARHNFLRELKAVFRRYNQASDGTAVVENHYLQTVTIRA